MIWRLVGESDRGDRREKSKQQILTAREIKKMFWGQLK